LLQVNYKLLQSFDTNKPLQHGFVIQNTSTASAAPHQTKIEHNYQLVPNADGYLHLIDLATYEVEPETHFNAAADIIFRVFTRRNPTAGQVITLNNAASLSNSNFRSSDPTR
jgi:hypothetical protein